MSTPSKTNHKQKYETRALCHTCLNSNLICTPHPQTMMPECAGCKDKRANPPKTPSQETGNNGTL